MVKSTNTADAARAAMALPPKSIVLVVGPTDTGKTTFAHRLIHEFSNISQIPVGYIDGDIGQTTLAPPGIVAGALVSPADAPNAPRTWPIVRSAFIGATSPVRHLLEWVTGVAVCIRETLAAGAGLVVVDTPGWVNGLPARLVYRCLIDIVSPDLILYFSRTKDANAVLDQFAGRVSPPVFAVVAPDPEATRKSSTARSARRAARFATYFHNASNHVIPWSTVTFLGTHFGTAPRQPRNILKFVGDTLHANCVYAARLPDGGVHAIVESDSPAQHRVGPIEEHFRTKPVVVTSAQSYDSLFCGLLDSSGRFLEAALIHAIDYDQETLTLLTPLNHPAPISSVLFGTIRVRPDGREVGELRPGGY